MTLQTMDRDHPLAQFDGDEPDETGGFDDPETEEVDEDDDDTEDEDDE